MASPDDIPKMFDPPTHRDREVEIRVRRMHRRDINRVWEFLKLVFRGVNRETVEYQRPRQKKRFLEIYEEDGIEQLVFEMKRGPKYDLVGYAEYAYEIVGSDSWMNHRYFETRGMRPLFVEEIAVHPSHHGMGIGTYMFAQIEHAARLRGCTHIVLEVAENNEEALRFYRKRNFHKLDAAIFLSRKLDSGGDLLNPRMLKLRPKLEQRSASTWTDSVRRVAAHPRDLQTAGDGAAGRKSGCSEVFRIQRDFRIEMR